MPRVLFTACLLILASCGSTPEARLDTTTGEDTTDASESQRDIGLCYEWYGKELQIPNGNECIQLLNEPECTKNEGCQWYSMKACSDGLSKEFCDLKRHQDSTVPQWSVVSPVWSHDCFLMKEKSVPPGWEECKYVFTWYDNKCLVNFDSCHYLFQVGKDPPPP